jgi:hypothetical protein
VIILLHTGLQQLNHLLCTQTGWGTVQLQQQLQARWLLQLHYQP